MSNQPFTPPPPGPSGQPGHPGPQGPSGPRVTRDDLRDVSRLRRVVQGRQVGGVAAGVARYFDVDPTVVRVAFGVTGLFGVGIVAYVALWILLPEDGSLDTPLGLDDRNRGVLLLGLAVLCTLGLLGGSWGWFDLPWQLVLVAAAVGVGLYVARRGESAPRSPDAPHGAAGTWPTNGPDVRPASGQESLGEVPPPTETGSSATSGTGSAAGPAGPSSTAPGAGQVWNGSQWTSPTGGQVSNPGGGWTGTWSDAGGTAQHTTTYAGPLSSAGGSGGWQYTHGPHGAGQYWVPAGEKRPRKRGPILFWWTLLTMLVAWLSMGLAGVTTASAYAAAGLGIVAGALVLGAFWGRAGGLILVGLLLVPVLAGVRIAEVVAGNPSVWRPSTAAQVQDSYRKDVGRLRLDLTQLSNPADLDGRTIEVSVDAGQIELVLPRDVSWRVEGAISGPGHLVLPESEQGGVDLQGTSSHHPGGARTQFTIEASVDIGEIKVRTADRVLSPTATDPSSTPTPSAARVPATLTRGDLR